MDTCPHCTELLACVEAAYPEGVPRSPELDTLVAAARAGSECFHRSLAAHIRKLPAPEGDLRGNTPLSRVWYAFHGRCTPEPGGINAEISQGLCPGNGVPMPPVDRREAALMEVAVAALQDDSQSPATRAAIASQAAAQVADPHLARVMRATAAAMAELEERPKKGKTN